LFQRNKKSPEIGNHKNNEVGGYIEVIKIGVSKKYLQIISSCAVIPYPIIG